MISIDKDELKENLIHYPPTTVQTHGTVTLKHVVSRQLLGSENIEAPLGPAYDSLTTVQASPFNEPHDNYGIARQAIGIC